MADIPKFEDTEEVIPNFEDTEEVSSTFGNTPSQLEAFARGAGEGATFGFSDEILGGLGAAKDVATTDKTISDFLDLYRQKRDVQEGERLEAEAAHPGTSVAGNLLGGIAVPGVGALGATAKGVGGVMKAGAIGGALAGLGTSDADLTKGEFLDAGKDVLSTAAAGALTGGVIHGGINLGKKGLDAAGKLDVVQNLVKSLNFGKKGVDLVTQEGREAIEKKLTDNTGEFVGDLEKARKAAGVEVGAQKKAHLASGVNTDVRDELKVLSDKADELLASDLPEMKAEGQRLKDFVNSKTTIEKDLEIPLGEFVPGKTIPAKEGTRKKMEYEIARLQDQANADGLNVTYKIRETEIQGKPHLAIQKLERKVGDTPEKLVATAGTSTSETVPVNKVKKLYTEISPETEQKAEEELFKLRAKAKLENTDKTYEVVRDEMDGTLGVVETSSKTRTIKGEPELSLDRGLESSIQEDFSAGKPVLDLPFVPEMTEPAQYKELGKYLARVKAGEKTTLSPEELQQLQRELAALGGYTDAGLKHAGPITQKVRGTISEKLPEGLRGANKKFSDYTNLIKDELKIDPSTLDFDEAGEIIINRNLETRIENTISRIAKDTQSGRTARRTIDRYFEGLEKLDKPLADKYREKFRDVAESYDLAEKTKNFNPLSPTHYYSKLPIRVGNAIGQGVKNAAENSPKTFQAAKNFSNKIGNAVKILSTGHQQGTAALAEKARAKGLNNLSDMLVKISENSDQIKRNALVFSLLQQPGYREQLNEIGEDIIPDLE
jgi:peptidoglycan hydrolase-like protein with peptidoglycan-binding domain